MSNNVNLERTWSATLSALAPSVDARLGELERARAVERIWAKDATLWKDDPDHQAVIRNRLGWLAIAELMMEHVDELRSLAQKVRSEGVRHIVLLGMGGSSLCVEVFRQVYGPQPDAPRLWVLDTTHPDVIRKLEAAIDLPNTLFIVASKSGTTTEAVSFDAHFFDRVQSLRGEEAGRQFIAITD
ncbi:MAG: hypothetical protein J7M34_07125, partial [Anaerolineae bacterium]|nr:hypothetical protein [Anaerolineae bacterium]